MKKEDKKINRMELIKNIALAAISVMSVMIFTEAWAAAKFDLDGGVAAGTGPLVTALVNHWGKGVLLVSGVCAVLGEGDISQRSKRALVGAAGAGATVLGLIAALS